MTAVVLRGDARRLPLPDASADLIVTSPPYFGLRSYTDGGGHYDGQIGSEATPQEWVAALVGCTAEWVRVLKPSGSLFVNLGDKYSGYTNGQGKGRNLGGGERGIATVPDGPVSAPTVYGVPNKALLGLPWRYALACMDELGLILRRDIIWSKPNGLPESVTDRCRSSHEYLFHFTVRPRYYAAVDEIRSPSDAPRRAGFTPPRGPALGPEVHAAIRTDDGPSLVRGWCQLGSIQEGIGAAVTRQAEGLQVLRPVGFNVRVETPERDYVIDLKAVSGSALDAATAIAFEDAFAKLWPAGPAPRLTAAAPVGVLLADVVLDDTSGRAEVLDLECVPVASEGLAARLTLDLHPGRATLLVWDSLAAHHSILPQRSEVGRHPATDYRIEREHHARNPLGKLPGSVWEIPSQPLSVPAHLGVDHFAAFPMELPRRVILGWSPPGICTECGEGRRPVADVGAPVASGHNRQGYRMPRTAPDSNHGTSTSSLGYQRAVSITGYACGCPDATAPVRPAVVVDPFGGTGTTALVASMLGRLGFSFDLSADYCRLARWRTTDPGERARALLVPKPPPVPDGQGSLFDDLEAS